MTVVAAVASLSSCRSGSDESSRAVSIGSDAIADETAVHVTLESGAVSDATADDADASTDAMSCEGFLDNAISDDIVIVFKNDRAAPVFVHPQSLCGGGPLFTLSSDGGVTYLWWYDVCAGTCEQLQTVAWYGCDGGCLVPPILRLEPGGSFEQHWDGTVLLPESMPSACYADPVNAAAPSCYRHTNVVPQAYQISANAATDCSSCTCDPDDSGSNAGSCLTQQGLLQDLGGSEVVASTTATLPDQKRVELVFR